MNVQVTCSAVGCVRGVCLKEPGTSWILSPSRPGSQREPLLSPQGLLKPEALLAPSTHTYRERKTAPKEEAKEGEGSFGIYAFLLTVNASTPLL